MKIRSMACLMKKGPAQFKERALSQVVLQARFLNGCVIRANPEHEARAIKTSSNRLKRN